MLDTLKTIVAYNTLAYYNSKKKIPKTDNNMILSSINAIILVAMSKSNPILVVNLCRGYMVYDTFHILNNINLYEKHYKNYLLHHMSVLLFVTESNVMNNIKAFQELVMVEITVPFMNILWFCKKYNVNNSYTKILKVIFFLLYSYYRIYNVLFNLYKNHKEYATYSVQLLYFFVGILNIIWYRSIIKIALKK